MPTIIGVVIDGGKHPKTTIRLPNMPTPGQLIELRDGTCVIVTGVYPQPAKGLIEAVVCAELASE